MWADSCWWVFHGRAAIPSSSRKSASSLPSGSLNFRNRAPSRGRSLCCRKRISRPFSVCPTMGSHDTERAGRATTARRQSCRPSPRRSCFPYQLVETRRVCSAVASCSDAPNRYRRRPQFVALWKIVPETALHHFTEETRCKASGCATSRMRRRVR